jgi:hypothetical protein
VDTVGKPSPCRDAVYTISASSTADFVSSIQRAEFASSAKCLQGRGVAIWHGDCRRCVQKTLLLKIIKEANPRAQETSYFHNNDVAIGADDPLRGNDGRGFDRLHLQKLPPPSLYQSIQEPANSLQANLQ